MSSTFEDILVESPLVRAEFKRMRELLGVQEKALTLSVTDLMMLNRALGFDTSTATFEEVQEAMESYLGRAAVRVSR